MVFNILEICNEIDNNDNKNNYKNNEIDKDNHENNYKDNEIDDKNNY